MRNHGLWFFSLAMLVLVLGVSGLYYRRHAAQADTLPAPSVPADYLHDTLWMQARHEVEHTVMPLLTREHSQLHREIKTHTFYRGSTQKKLIALTFDDGPHPESAPKLVAMLDRFHIHATFFVVGIAVEKNPQLVRAEVAAGNEIGNHTYHHIQPFKSLPEWEAATEIKADGEVIKSITGAAPHLFRPPGGGFNDRISIVSTALGYTTVMWTDDPGDFDPAISTQVLTDRLLRHVDNGAVILLHDGGKHTLDVLPTLIPSLQQRGYQFVTVSELIKQSH